MCCIFDRDDIWETPVFTEETCRRLHAAKPDAEFIAKDGGYVLKVNGFDEKGLFTCPALTEIGCLLGDDKPFDCRIWPFRIMEIDGRRAVTIASLCVALYSRAPSELVDFLNDGLADRIFAYANEHHEIVKPFSKGYSVLMFEERQ